MPDTPLKARRMVFPGQQQVLFEDFSLPAPSAGEVRVRTELTLMSTGTENIVFNRLFDEDTHWGRWVKYPFYPGYTAVGTVEAVGEGVDSFRVGDRVASRFSHQSHAVIPATECAPIPEGLAFEEAVWFALAKITFHGARAAKYQLGDSVLIIGAGPIGQMSARWARAAGVETIIVVDAVEQRLALAQAGGATATISRPIAEAKAAIESANGGKMPRVIIDSTGNAAVFSIVLGLAPEYGTVVLMGDTGQPAKQTLTSDLIFKGLTVVGAHDVHNTAEWNTATISRLFFSMARTGRFPLAGLNTHRFRPEACADAYATANRDRASTMGILFDWSAGS